MRIVPARILAIAAAAMLTTCAPSHGPGGPGGPGGPDREEEWHSPVGMLLRYADRDGNVTRAAMETGLKKDFAAADVNHSGVLELDEIRAVNEQRWKEDASATSPLVDWNGDEVVDFNEFAATARSLFDQLDKDGNGVLSPQELKPQRGGPRRPGGRPGGGPGRGGPGGPGGGGPGGPDEPN